jgi:hypothetical protein
VQERRRRANWERTMAGVWAVIALRSAVDVEFFSGVSRRCSDPAINNYTCTRRVDLRPGHRSRLPAFFVAC